jgi:anti-sigma regulatory factor (Ser/Thr protein kinase)
MYFHRTTYSVSHAQRAHAALIDAYICLFECAIPNTLEWGIEPRIPILDGLLIGLLISGSLPRKGRPPMSDAGARPDAMFELKFSPNLRLITTVRRFVSEFYMEVLGDADATSRLTVATHELLENAVKYSSDGHTSVTIAVTCGAAETLVTIDTENLAGEANRAALRETLSELERSASPMDFYQMLMRRSAKRTEGSGLGLGRIHAEADMSISCQIDGETVVLRAQTRVETKRAS